VEVVASAVGRNKGALTLIAAHNIRTFFSSQYYLFFSNSLPSNTNSAFQNKL
jgi:hypothetical protein